MDTIRSLQQLCKAEDDDLRWLMALVSDTGTLGVSRPNLHERVSGKTKPRRRYHEAQDAALLPLIERLVAKRPTCGDRRITAVLNRKLRADGLAPANHKRVWRIMKAHNLRLARKYTERPEQAHNGKVVVMRSNRGPLGANQWRRNGRPNKASFIDAHDREVSAWRVVVNAGISGSDIRDMMLEAVERRFGACQASDPVEVLTDNGAPYTAKDTRIFARQLGLRLCFPPVKSPQSNGLSLVHCPRTSGGQWLALRAYARA